MDRQFEMAWDDLTAALRPDLWAGPDPDASDYVTAGEAVRRFTIKQEGNNCFVNRLAARLRERHGDRVVIDPGCELAN